MDSRAQRVFINAAVCLYAVLGFSLSVLTSLLSLLGARQSPKPINILHPKPSKPHLQPLAPRSRPVTPTLRSCSDKPATSAKLSASTLEDKQRRRKLLASHRRSRSIPLITLDYFGSTENNVPHGHPDLGSLPVRKPLTFVLPPPPGRERIEAPWSADYDSEKSGFKLANLFSKDKKREKENIRKVKEGRTPSPPATPHQLENLALQPQSPGKRRKSDISKYPLLSKEGQENTVRTPMRRVSSAPAEEKLSMRFDLTFSRTVEKKKSGTLRTQPYEAPFFCPPPVQPTRLKSRSTLDLTSKYPKGPSKSSTMKI